MDFKRPESVLVIVHTAQGEVLQLRRIDPPDFWQSVTGSLHHNESALHAAKRELLEETGLVADAGLVDTGVVNHYPIYPAWRHKFAPDVTGNTEYVFALQLPERTDIQLNPDEHTEFRWLLRAAAASSASSHTDRDAILAVVPEA
jgi:dihydroneopterin triphosphate diphosphatase